MGRHCFTITFFSYVLIYGSGCDRNGLNAKDRAEFSSFSKGINRASSLMLYEGLPHHHFEADALDKELATKKTVIFHGFPFYEHPIEVVPADVEPLRQLSTTENGFSSIPQNAAKSCGGFHPDYCLVWQDGAAIYELLICFGCREIKFYGPKQEMRVDIHEANFHRFEASLKKYQNQRPKLE